MALPGLPVGEFIQLVQLLEKRWPGCTVGRPEVSPYHEVRTAEGRLIVAHKDLGECVRAAATLARSKEPKP